MELQPFAVEHERLHGAIAGRARLQPVERRVEVVRPVAGEQVLVGEHEDPLPQRRGVVPERLEHVERLVPPPC